MKMIYSNISFIVAFYLLSNFRSIKTFYPTSDFSFYDRQEAKKHLAFNPNDKRSISFYDWNTEREKFHLTEREYVIIDEFNRIIPPSEIFSLIDQFDFGKFTNHLTEDQRYRFYRRKTYKGVLYRFDPIPGWRYHNPPETWKNHKLRHQWEKHLERLKTHKFAA